MPEDKPSAGYDIRMSEGVETRLRECLSAIREYRSAIETTETIAEHDRAQRAYVKALESFTHCLVNMVTTNGMGDVNVFCTLYGGSELSFDWRKGAGYEGGMIYHVRDGGWSIHT